MKINVRDVSFGPDSLIIGADCYFEEGESGYEDCWVEIPDYELLEGNPPAPTHLEFQPFRSVSISCSVDATETEIRDRLKNTLEAFKRAHQKVNSAQALVGLEVKA